jgi:hypothetical protein
MQNPPPNKNRAHCSASALLFRQSANDGRDTLNHEELRTLLSSMELDFAPGQAGPPPTVELRISLDNTREFGMVISAGSGANDHAEFPRIVQTDAKLYSRRRPGLTRSEIEFHTGKECAEFLMVEGIPPIVCGLPEKQGAGRTMCTVLVRWRILHRAPGPKADVGM